MESRSGGPSRRGQWIPLHKSRACFYREPSEDTRGEPDFDLLPFGPVPELSLQPDEGSDRGREQRRGSRIESERADRRPVRALWTRSGTRRITGEWGSAVTARVISTRSMAPSTAGGGPSTAASSTDSFGPARLAGETRGLTRAQAEKLFRKLQDAEDRAPRPRVGEVVPTVDEIADALRRQLRLRGSRRSYLEGCESMQRVHISPRLGARSVSQVKTAHVEALATSMLDAGRAPKTARNVLTFLHSVFELAHERGLVSENPVRRATRPGRRRKGDANPDLQFLTVEELDAVIRAIPARPALARRRLERCSGSGSATRSSVASTRARASPICRPAVGPDGRSARWRARPLVSATAYGATTTSSSPTPKPVSRWTDRR